MFLGYCEPGGLNSPWYAFLSCRGTFNFIQHRRTRSENLSKRLSDVGDCQVGYTVGRMDWTVDSFVECVALSCASLLFY